MDVIRVLNDNCDCELCPLVHDLTLTPKMWTTPLLSDSDTQSSSFIKAPPLSSLLTDWLMARPAQKSTFSQNCKPNLPNVKFVHRSFLFSLKSYFNAFPNYTQVTKNRHLRTAFHRLFPSIKMLFESLLKLLRFTAGASPRRISTKCISRIREPEPDLKSRNVCLWAEPGVLGMEENPLSAYWWSCPSTQFLPRLIPNEPVL